jgi:hypothetical protein
MGALELLCSKPGILAIQDVVGTKAHQSSSKSLDLSTAKLASRSCTYKPSTALGSDYDSRPAKRQ